MTVRPCELDTFLIDWRGGKTGDARDHEYCFLVKYAVNMGYANLLVKSGLLVLAALASLEAQTAAEPKSNGNGH